MNTNIDRYIDWLQKGSEVQYNWIIYIIQNFNSHDVELLEKGETNIEELMDVTWGDLSEEIELLNLLETKQKVPCTGLSKIAPESY